MLHSLARRSFRLARVALVLAFVAACGKEGTPDPVAPVVPGPPDPLGPPAGAHAGVNFVLPVALDDSVQGSGRLVVVAYLRDANNAPIAHAHVFFTRHSRKVAGRELGSFGFCGYDPIRCASVQSAPIAAEVDSTDANGRVATLIRMTDDAGDSYLVLTAADVNVVDSTAVHVRAGAAAKLVVAPLDTVVYVGNDVALRIAATDRLGNVASTATLSAPGRTVTTSGTTIRGASIGRATVTVRTDSLTVAVGVSVVPVARIAAVDRLGIATFDLDGSGFDHVPGTGVGGLPAPLALLAPRWLSAENRLVASLPVAGVERLFVIDATGATSRLIADTATTAESWPEAGIDGWVYFVGEPISGSGRGARVWRMRRAAGAAPELIADAGSRDAFASTGIASRSADGSLLAVMNGSQVEVYEVATHHLRFVVAGEAPRFSPDGARLAYVAPNGHVLIVSAAGTSTFDAGCAAQCVGSLDWSADGQWIVATQKPTGLVVLSTTAPLELPLPFAAGLSQPSWRP